MLEAGVLKARPAEALKPAARSVSRSRQQYFKAQCKVAKQMVAQ